MLLNISSDKVIIHISDKMISLDRNTIEDTLGETLIRIFRDEKISEMVLLNGPGGFTNLRVGTLCLNLLNSILGNKVKIYDISKIQLYQYLVGQGFLPNIGIVYIGQRKNVWLYDFSKNSYNTIKKDDIPYQEDIFIDYVVDQDYYKVGRSFGRNLEGSYEVGRNNPKKLRRDCLEGIDKIIEIEYISNLLSLSFGGKRIDLNVEKVFDMESQYSVEANYFIPAIK